MRSSGFDDLGGERRDIGAGVAERTDAGGDEMRLERRQVALQVDDDVGAAVGIDASDGFKDAIRARRVIGPGHHRLAAGSLYGGHDLGGVCRDHDASRVGGDRAAPHVDDHRRTGDIDHRLAGQARCLHARGDDDEGIAARLRTLASIEPRQLVPGACT